MKNKLEGFSLSSYTVKHKLSVAFQLMSILPLLVCVYLVSNYILPKFGLKIDVIVTVLISIFVSIIGLFVIKEIFDRLTAVSKEAKLIADGDINRKLTIAYGDEVDDLGLVLNKLTQRIRGNMEELKTYSEKTHEINIEIQKRVVILSNLMQISSLIAQGGKCVDILRMAVEKSRLLANSETAFLLYKEENDDFFSMKIVDGAKAHYLMSVTVSAKEEIYSRIFNLNRLLMLDKDNRLDENLTVAFLEKFQLKNCLALPIFLRGSVKAVLGIGNTREGFLYTKDDVELMSIFSKQVAIAMENDFLSYRIEKLEIKDTLTGLYNQSFIFGRLQEEIQRAIIYQRPCALVIFDIDNFKLYREKFGLISTEATIKKIAILMRDSITEIDRLGRTDDDEFTLILPEKNKRQAQEVAEGIRKKIELVYGKEQDSDRRISVSAGVSENPLDGIKAEQLIIKARELLNKAKAEGKNRVMVF